MSKHETALALLEEQIERAEKERQDARGKKAMAQAALERAEKELKLLDWTLSELHNSANLLETDRSKAAHPAATPGPRV